MRFSTLSSLASALVSSRSWILFGFSNLTHEKRCYPPPLPSPALKANRFSGLKAKRRYLYPGASWVTLPIPSRTTSVMHFLLQVLLVVITVNSCATSVSPQQSFVNAFMLSKAKKKRAKFWQGGEARRRTKNLLSLSAVAGLVRPQWVTRPIIQLEVMPNHSRYRQASLFQSRTLRSKSTILVCLLDVAAHDGH